MLEEYEKNDSTALLLAQFACLVMELAKFSTLKKEIPKAATRRILDVVTYINANFKEELSLDILAASAYMSRAHFCRQFKKVIGFSPVEYIHNMRLCKADAFLENTDMPIAEIAERVGFSSGNYFGDLFRRYRGMSPRDWRERMRNS